MKHIPTLLFALFAISCANETTSTEENIIPEITCTYAFDNDSTKVNWTAFKFTEKKGVGGTFANVNVLTIGDSDDMFNTLTGATFTIEIGDINSKNPERDAKLKSSFFGNLNTEIISGLVKTIDSNEATVEITMNNISKDYIGKVSVNDLTVDFKTAINLLDFEGQVAIDSLNVVCKDLHKGADGISKLWSEVDISVSTTLKKNCK